MTHRLRLDRLLDMLRQFTAELEALRGVPRTDLLRNSDKVGNAKHCFIVAIEACNDIGNHIVASEGLRLPSDNADTFGVLAEAGVIAAEDEDACRAMARFRHRLVHLYWDVDPGRLFEYPQEGPVELRRFAADVARFASSQADRDTGSPPKS